MSVGSLEFVLCVHRVPSCPLAVALNCLLPMKVGEGCYQTLSQVLCMPGGIGHPQPVSHFITYIVSPES